MKAEDLLRCEFDEPQRAITPGQAVVFYDGDIVVGEEQFYMVKQIKSLGNQGCFYLINLISLILSFQPFYFFLCKDNHECEEQG